MKLKKQLLDIKKEKIEIKKAKVQAEAKREEYEFELVKAKLQNERMRLEMQQFQSKQQHRAHSNSFFCLVTPVSTSWTEAFVFDGAAAINENEVV